MKYTHLFFDLDGTLTESGPGIMNCVKYALEKFGINESDTEKLKRFIGPPLVNSFMDFYNFSESDA
ncbi:MAG: HAD hydrolase-like protein, partial [Treponema sp.]|nr:HAD hydrolase-like protein [Treponema sp.]MBR6913293.1 HAD hydrolase-like protein [Treponema sp.]